MSRRLSNKRLDAKHVTPSAFPMAINLEVDKLARGDPMGDDPMGDDPRTPTRRGGLRNGNQLSPQKVRSEQPPAKAERPVERPVSLVDESNSKEEEEVMAEALELMCDPDVRTYFDVQLSDPHFCIYMRSYMVLSEMCAAGVLDAHDGARLLEGVYQMQFARGANDKGAASGHEGRKEQKKGNSPPKRAMEWALRARETQRSQKTSGRCGVVCTDFQTEGKRKQGPTDDTTVAAEEKRDERERAFVGGVQKRKRTWGEAAAKAASRLYTKFRIAWGAQPINTALSVLATGGLAFSATTMVAAAGAWWGTVPLAIMARFLYDMNALVQASNTGDDHREELQELEENALIEEILKEAAKERGAASLGATAATCLACMYTTSTFMKGYRSDLEDVLKEMKANKGIIIPDGDAGEMLNVDGMQQQMRHGWAWGAIFWKTPNDVARQDTEIDALAAFIFDGDQRNKELMDAETSVRTLRAWEEGNKSLMSPARDTFMMQVIPRLPLIAAAYRLVGLSGCCLPAEAAMYENVGGEHDLIPRMVMAWSLFGKMSVTAGASMQTQAQKTAMAKRLFACFEFHGQYTDFGSVARKTQAAQAGINKPDLPTTYGKDYYDRMVEGSDLRTLKKASDQNRTAGWKGPKLTQENASDLWIEEADKYRTRQIEYGSGFSEEEKKQIKWLVRDVNFMGTTRDRMANLETWLEQIGMPTPLVRAARASPMVVSTLYTLCKYVGVCMGWNIVPVPPAVIPVAKMMLTANYDDKLGLTKCFSLSEYYVFSAMASASRMSRVFSLENGESYVRQAYSVKMAMDPNDNPNTVHPIGEFVVLDMLNYNQSLQIVHTLRKLGLRGERVDFEGETQYTNACGYLALYWAQWIRDNSIAAMRKEDALQFNNEADVRSLNDKLFRDPAKDATLLTAQNLHLGMQKLSADENLRWFGTTCHNLLRDNVEKNIARLRARLRDAPDGGVEAGEKQVLVVNTSACDINDAKTVQGTHWVAVVWRLFSKNEMEKAEALRLRKALGMFVVVDAQRSALMKSVERFLRNELLFDGRTLSLSQPLHNTSGHFAAGLAVAMHSALYSLDRDSFKEDNLIQYSDKEAVERVKRKLRMPNDMSADLTRDQILEYALLQSRENSWLHVENMDEFKKNVLKAVFQKKQGRHVHVVGEKGNWVTVAWELASQNNQQQGAPQQGAPQQGAPQQGANNDFVVVDPWATSLADKATEFLTNKQLTGKLLNGGFQRRDSTSGHVAAAIAVTLRSDMYAKLDSVTMYVLKEKTQLDTVNKVKHALGIGSDQQNDLTADQILGYIRHNAGASVAVDVESLDEFKTRVESALFQRMPGRHVHVVGKPGNWITVAWELASQNNQQQGAPQQGAPQLGANNGGGFGLPPLAGGW